MVKNRVLKKVEDPTDGVSSLAMDKGGFAST